MIHLQEKLEKYKGIEQSKTKTENEYQDLKDEMQDLLSNVE